MPRWLWIALGASVAALAVEGRAEACTRVEGFSIAAPRDGATVAPNADLVLTHSGVSAVGFEAWLTLPDGTLLELTLRDDGPQSARARMPLDAGGPYRLEVTHEFAFPRGPDEVTFTVDGPPDIDPPPAPARWSVELIDRSAGLPCFQPGVYAQAVVAPSGADGAVVHLELTTPASGVIASGSEPASDTGELFLSTHTGLVPGQRACLRVLVDDAAGNRTGTEVRCIGDARPDAGPVDAAFDAGPADAARDAGVGDAAAPDLGRPDARAPDAGATGAGRFERADPGCDCSAAPRAVFGAGGYAFVALLVLASLGRRGPRRRRP
jgi:hypothetical protein